MLKKLNMLIPKQGKKIQDKQYQLKHIYSYMKGECLCKDFIPLDMVKAIGVPYQKLRLQGKEAHTIQLIDDIKKLMGKYDLYLPIVDTSRYNSILYEIGCQIYIKKKSPIIQHL